MYDRTSTCTMVNAARKDLFTRKGRDIESIPPTADALLQHAKRATYIKSQSLLGKVFGSITSASSSKQVGLGTRP